MITIIGAGFSGLSLAYHFVKHGHKVTLIDKRDRAGGVIDSYIQNGVLIESAANGFLSSQKIEELFKDIGLTPQKTRSESKKKYIFRGQMRRWPLTASETIVLLGRLTFAILTLNKKAKPSESLKQWAERVLGSAGNKYLIQPMVNGIFAEKTEFLDAELVLNSLFFKRQRGEIKGLISSKNGMGEVIRKLEEWLKKRGTRFEYGQSENLELNSMNHNTCFAVNFLSLVSALTHSTSVNPFTSKNDLTSRSLVRVTISFKNKVDEIDGFGVLFPNEEAMNALGVLANSKIFENRGEYNESWIFSDSQTPDVMTLSDSEIIQRIIQDRKRLFKSNPASNHNSKSSSSSDFEIKDVSIHRWPNVIPSYNAALKEFIRANSALTQKLTGNYLGVLGLTGIHERNFQLVETYCVAPYNKDQP